MVNIKKIFDFLHEVENLKRTERFKTVDYIEGDSVASHSWRLALMAFIIAEELKLDLDVLKSIKLALAHDLPESITDDIDAKAKLKNNISDQQKKDKEEKAMKELERLLPETTGKNLFNLWKEYEDGETKEACFIKILDKIEGVITQIELSKEGFDGHEFAGIYGHKEIKKFPEILKIFEYYKSELKNKFNEHNLGWEKKYDDYK